MMAQNRIRSVQRGQKLSRRRLLGAAGAGGVGLIAAAGAGCSASRKPASSSQNPAAAGPPRRGGTFTYYWNANPPSLDPQFFSTGATTSFACAMMSGLFRFKIAADPQISLNHDLENELAVSAESPDALTWTIKLRPDATFHNIPPVNGHAVEAEDIKATFVRGVTSQQNPNRGTIAMIDPEQIETPAKDTIVFKLKYPYAPLTSLMASVQYGLIYPREVLTGGYDPGKQIIGSGPFVFESYTPDVQLVMKRNPNYFEQGLPYLDGVRHAIIPATAQQEAQFAAGNLDLLHVAQNDMPSATKSAPSARVIKTIGGGDFSVYFQLGDPSSPFQDIRLRQAVSMAIDRDAMGKSLDDGLYEPGFIINLSLGQWALHFNQLDPSVQQYYTYNLQQAKQLVQQAGGSNLNLKLAYPAHAFQSDFDTLAQDVFNMLHALPWNITLVPVDYNKDYLAGGKGYLYGFFPADTMVLGGLNPFGEVDQYIHLYWYSTSPSNKEHLKDPTIDTMADKARGIIDVQARRQAYLDIQKYIVSKVYSATGLPNGYTYTLTQAKAQGYSYSAETNSDGRSFRTIWFQG